MRKIIVDFTEGLITITAKLGTETLKIGSGLDSRPGVHYKYDNGVFKRFGDVSDKSIPFDVDKMEVKEERAFIRLDTADFLKTCIDRLHDREVLDMDDFDIDEDNLLFI